MQRIYADGIASRGATLETEPPSVQQLEQRVASALPRHAWVVAVGSPPDGSAGDTTPAGAGDVRGWAATMPYSGRACYDGVAEFSVYVDAVARGQGIGSALMRELIERSTAAGLHKLTSRVFVTNTASRAMMRSLGFREVGVHQRHGRLDGKWIDVVTVELLLGDAATDAEP